MPRHGHARTELHVAEASTVQRIPLEQIRVLNPRVRNRQVFARLVENIAALGLKRPITVTPATRGSDAAFEIICGQGRFEAFQALGEKVSPA